MAKLNNVIVHASSPNSRRDCHDDFGFVLIEKNFEANATDDDDDDDDDDADSYDYCEDVCSIISGRNRQEHDGDTDLSSEGIDDNSILRLTCLKDSALSVPLVLLKDLDEAHEAAKLTQISNLDVVTDLITTCSDDDYIIHANRKNVISSSSPKNYVLEETKNDKADKLERSNPISFMLNKDNDDPASIDDSSLELSFKANEASHSSAIDRDSTPKNKGIRVLPETTTGKKSISNEVTAAAQGVINSDTKNLKGMKKQNEKSTSSGCKNDINSNKVNRTTSVPVSISRASNKKRRKRLKLLKKVQAAEKFQQQAAFANLSPPLEGKNLKKILKHSKKQLHATPSRLASKKVANIAVSCAIDSISSYREELRRQQGTQ